MITTNLEAGSLPTALRQQAYNAMDAALTHGIGGRLGPKIAAKPDEALVYAFERAMQGPAFTMQMRGIAVDEVASTTEIKQLVEDESAVIRSLNALAKEWGVEGINPHSPKQVGALLYEACGEKPYRAKKKKVVNAEEDPDELGATANEDALTMLQARSPVIGIMAHLVLRARELRKLRSFVDARRSPDGRLRSSFNVGATTSGRWSFSKDPFGNGLNFGNIPKRARSMFVPSTPTRVMVNCDLKQAESYIVAYLANDRAYVAAHETGDVHSAVAQDLWPGTSPREPGFLRGMSRRDVAKRIGHGTNYGIGERKSSKITGLPIHDIMDFREAFFARYPKVKARIDGMEDRLKANPRFVSVMGRPHRHMGAPWDGETHRTALADEPQGVVADIMNVAIWRLWHRHDVGDWPPKMWLLSQAYDSVLFEVEEEDLRLAKTAVAIAFNIKVPVNGHNIVIPYDIGYGRNWREACA